MQGLPQTGAQVAATSHLPIPRWCLPAGFSFWVGVSSRRTDRTCRRRQTDGLLVDAGELNDGNGVIGRHGTVVDAAEQAHDLFDPAEFGAFFLDLARGEV